MVFCLQSRLSLFKSHPFRCRRYTIERTRTRMRRSLISKAYERTRVYIFLICALCSVACGAVCAMMVNPCVRQNVTGFKLIYGWNRRLKTKKYRAERGTAEDGKCKRSNTPVIINFLKNTRHGCANGYRLEATLHAQRLRKGRTPFCLLDSDATRLDWCTAAHSGGRDACRGAAASQDVPKTARSSYAAQSIAHELLPGEGRRGVRVGSGVEGVRRGRARMR